MSFNFSLFFIQEELRQMARYLDVIVAALESNFKRADSAYEEAMKEEIPDGKSSDDYSDDYVEWITSQHEDELMEAGRDFPQLLLVSFVILWYSFVEQKLLDFCDELGLTISITL